MSIEIGDIVSIKSGTTKGTVIDLKNGKATFLIDLGNAVFNTVENIDVKALKKHKEKRNADDE